MNFSRLTPYRIEKNTIEVIGYQVDKKLRLAVYGGDSLLNYNQPIAIEFKRLSAKTVDYCELSGLPIVSEKLKNILSSSSDCDYLEFIPVSTNLGKEYPYYLLNILENIKCMNWEKSEFTTFPKREDASKSDRPDVITNLVLNEDKINGRNIFRMYEARTNIFISNQLALEFVKNKITGCIFVKTPNLCYVYDPE